MQGLLECETVESSVDGDTFYQFVSLKLLPLLMPFDGVNSHSIVVMDNASIHHVDGISELISSAGSLLIYLPPTHLTTIPLKRHFQR